MIERFARLRPPVPRRLTPLERVWLRLAEAALTAGAFIGLATFGPVALFAGGIGFAFVLQAIARWEAAGG